MAITFDVTNFKSKIEKELRTHLKYEVDKIRSNIIKKLADEINSELVKIAYKYGIKIDTYFDDYEYKYNINISVTVPDIESNNDS